jgi:tRNA(fMet)-specific endonuclease VapC
MKGYLLDTNVLSEVIKKKPARTVIRRLREVSARKLFTSSICVMELRHGASRHPDRGTFWARIERDVLARVRVLGVGSGEALRAGDVLTTLRAAGDAIELEDVLIAATALENDLVVVTRNVRHFSPVPDLAVESWWSS